MKREPGERRQETGLGRRGRKHQGVGRQETGDGDVRRAEEQGSRGQGSGIRAS